MVDLTMVKNGEVLTNSVLIADVFKKPHNRVLQSIEKVKADIEKLVVENVTAEKDEYFFREIEREIKGRKYKAYEMNRNSFSLIAMSFTGKKALKWKLDFIRAFNEMEKRLLRIEANQDSLEWKQQREQGKLARREETDVIQKFVELAKSQGSKSAQWYYKHFTNATYKALQLIEAKKPKLRDTLDMMELNQLILAENVAMKSLEENMKSGEHYKAIFVNVKNDIERFASTLFLPNQKQLK